MNKNPRWVRVARCQDIPLREGRAVRLGSREIAIFNLGERFLAVANQCPHRGGPLADGIVSGGRVVCPLHLSQFDLRTGQVMNPPAEVPLQRFNVKIEGDTIFVEV